MATLTEVDFDDQIKLKYEFQFHKIMGDLLKDIQDYFSCKINVQIKRALSEWYFLLLQESWETFLPSSTIGIKHEATKKLIKELNHISLNTNINNEPFEKYLWHHVDLRKKQRLNQANLHIPNVSWKQGGVFVVGDVTVRHKRITHLKEKFKCSDYQLARLALAWDLQSDRLNYIGHTGQELPEVVDLLYNDFGVRFEAFASPLDSVLMWKPETKWCSLHSDLDAKFGSSGNFFNVDLSDQENQGCWFVNPPFMEDLMADMAFKILHSLKYDQVRSCFFIVLPNWTDTWAWNNLRQSRFCLAVLDGVTNCFLSHKYSLGTCELTCSKRKSTLSYIIVGHPDYVRDDFNRIADIKRPQKTIRNYEFN